MQFKYVAKTIDRTAKMLLYDKIGDGGINGNMFAYELNWIAESGQYDAINLHINCIGGDVVQGFSIFSAIASSKIPVYAYIDFMAASMGGIIPMSCKKIYMARNGLLMIHAPYNPENPEEKSTVIDKIKGSLVSVLNQRTGKDLTVELEKETWYTAEDALKIGLVDSIYNPVVSKKAVAVKDFNYVNKVSQQLINSMDPLEKEILQGEVDKAKKILAQKEQELEALKAEKKATEQKLAQANESIQKQRDKEAIEFVDSLVMSGKAKKEQREEILVSAKKDIDLVKSVYANIPVSVANRLSNVVDLDGSKKDDRSGWTYRDWESKDLSGLQNMYKNDREKYNELLKQLSKNGNNK